MKRIVLLLVVLTCGMVYAQSSGIVRSWHFPTVNVAPVNSAGVALSVASAAPPSVNIGVSNQPFLIDPAANTTKVGAYGIYGAGAISNLCQRASFETWAAGVPSGWAEGVTSTGDCAEQTTAIAHLASSARCTLADADDAVTLTSACLTVTGSTAYYGSLFARLESGTGLLDLNIIEDDSADCLSPTTTTAIVNDAVPTGTWTKYGASITTQAATIRVQVQVSLPATAAQVLDVDAVQFRACSIPTDAYCGCDTDATCACNTADITDDAPPVNMTGTWEFEATIRSPIDGAVATDFRYILTAPGTAGNNNGIRMYWKADLLFCLVYDSAGSAKSNFITAAGNADTDYVVKMSKSAGGVIQCCWDGTCDATPATGALTNGLGSEIQFGGFSGTGADVWIQDPVIRRRLTP